MELNLDTGKRELKARLARVSADKRARAKEPKKAKPEVPAPEKPKDEMLLAEMHEKVNEIHQMLKQRHSNIKSVLCLPKVSHP